MSGRGMPEDWEIWRKDLVGLVTWRKWVNGVVSGEIVTLTSASIVGRSVRRSSVKWAASWEPVVLISSSVGRDVAVVSQRPGSWGCIGLGRMEVDVGIGICSDRVKAEVKLIWAILELDMLLYKVDIPFARLD